MCRRINCSKCGRPTFAGCGAHVEQVLGDVPREKRCHCREDKAKEGKAGEAQERPSWLRSLFGK